MWQKVVDLLIQIIPIVISGSLVALITSKIAERKTNRERKREKYIQSFGNYVQNVRDFLIDINELYQKLLNLFVYMKKLNETGKVLFNLNWDFQTDPLINVVNGNYQTWFQNKKNFDKLDSPQELRYKRIIDGIISYIQNPDLLQDIIHKFDTSCRGNLILIGEEKIKEHEKLILKMQEGTFADSKYSIMDFKTPIVEYLIKLEKMYAVLNESPTIGT